MGKISLVLSILIVLIAIPLWQGRMDNVVPLLQKSRELTYREPGWLPPKSSDRWRCIVIHHSATDFGGAARFDRAHRQQGWDELGYHFVIGNGTDTGDGEVEIGPRWTEQKHGAHCKTPDEYYNEHGIGICLVGNFEKDRPTAAQMQSLTRLVRFLSQQYNIPRSRIFAHGKITGLTLCPGRNTDLQRIRDAVGTKE